MTTAIQETMSESAQSDLQGALLKALAELETLKGRVSQLETLAKGPAPEAPHPVATAPQEAVTREAAPVVQKGITEEEVLAISAAIAAWLGVQAHIRQIRLIRTGAWAQQGRVTIQASHRLY